MHGMTEGAGLLGMVAGTRTLNPPMLWGYAKGLRIFGALGVDLLRSLTCHLSMESNPRSDYRVFFARFIATSDAAPAAARSTTAATYGAMSVPVLPSSFADVAVALAGIT